jgi:hypothetical protein
MDIKPLRESVFAANRALDNFDTRVASLNPSHLKPEVYRTLKAELMADCLDTQKLTEQRRTIAAGVGPVQAARQALQNPNHALVVAAWKWSEKVTPGHMAFLDGLRHADPELLAAAIDTANGNPAVLHGLSGIVESRQGELDPVVREQLRGQVKQTASRFVDRAAVCELAKAELDAHKAIARIDAISAGPLPPEDKLTQARQWAELEALVDAK